MSSKKRSWGVLFFAVCLSSVCLTLPAEAQSATAGQPWLHVDITAGSNDWLEEGMKDEFGTGTVVTARGVLALPAAYPLGLEFGASLTTDSAGLNEVDALEFFVGALLSNAQAENPFVTQFGIGVSVVDWKSEIFGPEIKDRGIAGYVRAGGYWPAQNTPFTFIVELRYRRGLEFDDDLDPRVVDSLQATIGIGCKF